MRETLRRGAALVLSLLASACASSTGGTVLFSSPEGGTVRIGTGRAHRLPWSTHLELGSHPVEIRPRVPPESAGLSSGEDAVRGWLVVVSSWKGGPAEFKVTPQDWIDATDGLDLYVTGATPSWWVPAFRFKGSVDGVPEDDPEVEDWRTEAAMERSKGSQSKTLAVLEDIGMGIVYVVAFVFILAVEVVTESADECGCE